MTKNNKPEHKLFCNAESSTSASLQLLSGLGQQLYGAWMHRTPSIKRQSPGESLLTTMKRTRVCAEKR